MLTLFYTFFKIGLFTFGGGYSMIPLIHFYAVDKYKWLTEKEFIDIIAIAESTPGPIAINSATYVGYKVLGVKGSAFATLGVVLPSLVIIMVISAFFMQYKENPYVEYAFMGIRVGVAVLIWNAALRIFKKVEKSILAYILAAFGLFMAFFNVIPVVFIILIGGVIGVIYYVFINKSEVNKDA